MYVWILRKCMEESVWLHTELLRVVSPRSLSHMENIWKNSITVLGFVFEIFLNVLGANRFAFIVEEQGCQHLRASFFPVVRFSVYTPFTPKRVFRFRHYSPLFPWTQFWNNFSFMWVHKTSVSLNQIWYKLQFSII